MSAVTDSVCPTCGELTPALGRFCVHCAAPQQQTCPVCGEPTVPGARFCSQCAAPLGTAASPQASVVSTAVSERRLVSVLFADLVGFTTLSERRDPEEVRELLSQYFNRCRSLIRRYGGTVEKFIGDAVMAVWGAPVAREDDAERAVRAALALTQAVPLLGEEVGMPDLRVRAGVLTGSAAVEVGAEGEGMVLGDTVNTASRLQSIAQPGTVLVDDVTHRSSEAAIEYDDAGEHTVKGREQPVHAWTALRVVAGVGGARRSAGLEAPFVGREPELQSIVETAESSGEERRSKLVAVVGPPGSGKSRLLWEYFKYVDGVEKVVLWHQGRCLSYGDGVAYWALAEIVRGRAQINEDDRPEVALAKLRETVREFVSEERERRLIEPRLAHLLRLEDRPDSDRADLFSGWRLFFERLSEDAPVILVFEDLQWADSGLLDFIDYLLEWSADYPIFVLALARPELRERRKGWPSLELAPMDPPAIAAILEGLAPGLSEDVVVEIARRAEGLPLYAVETIRMLKDRGALTQEGARYVLTGDVSELDVPETLQALVASRLDGLTPAERTIVQNVSVLGQSFTLAAAAAVSSQQEPEVASVLDGLVAKQVLGHDDDPRSPERGQYAFLQTLVRTVAYGTLSRRTRKTRHLAAARHLESTWPGEARDIAEVLADHYLHAIDAEPDATDASSLRDSARETLTAAGQAAARLALGAEADRYFAQAADLAIDELERAILYEAAGQALWRAGDTAQAEVRLRHAIELYRQRGRQSGGSAAVTLAKLIAPFGRMVEARELLKRFLATEPPDADRVLRAQAQAALAHWTSLTGDPLAAESLFTEALSTLEREGAMPELAEAMARRSTHLDLLQRPEEQVALARHARSLAEQHDVISVALRATGSICASLIGRDRFTEAIGEAGHGLETARERGDGVQENFLLAALAQCYTALGRWDEAMELIPKLMALTGAQVELWAAPYAAQIADARGDAGLMARALEVAGRARNADEADAWGVAAGVEIRDQIRRGAFAEALREVTAVLHDYTASGESVTDAYWLGVDAALATGDDTAIATLIAYVDESPAGLKTPLRRAGSARLRAQRAHLADDEPEAKRNELEAEGLLGELGARPALADALLDRARRRGDEDAVAQARAIFEELGATARLQLLDERFGVTA
jgi:class 3 adenylate cyclase/tetratricopeptide (TPR) repeat protein